VIDFLILKTNLFLVQKQNFSAKRESKQWSFQFVVLHVENKSIHFTKTM